MLPIYKTIFQIHEKISSEQNKQKYFSTTAYLQEKYPMWCLGVAMC